MSKRVAWALLSKFKPGITKREFSRLVDDMGFWFDDFLPACDDTPELMAAYCTLFG